MDLKKRLEKLEKARSTADSPTSLAPPQTEYRQLTIEEWNELYVKPYQESLRRKPEKTAGSE